MPCSPLRRRGRQVSRASAVDFASQSTLGREARSDSEQAIHFPGRSVSNACSESADAFAACTKVCDFPRLLEESTLRIAPRRTDGRKQPATYLLERSPMQSSSVNRYSHPAGRGFPDFLSLLEVPHLSQRLLLPHTFPVGSVFLDFHSLLAVRHGR